MDHLKENKQKKIQEIVSIVKLAALLFSGIVLLRYFFKGNTIAEVTVDTNYNFISFFVVILILLSVYFMWSMATVEKIDFKYINIVQIIENLAFILFFIIVIFYSGKSTSDYKFLFLFIIITSTLQQGMNQGMLVASISSIFILSLDLVMGAPNVQVNQFFENDLILAGVFILTAWPLGFYVRIENEHIKKLEGLANEDGLTGLYNHRFFYDALEGIMKTSEKENDFVAMILIDIDYFKIYNDMNGHQMGDEALKSVGFILKNSFRKSDVVARYGGEEFAVVLPNTSEEDAIKLAEKSRKKIEATYFSGEENQPNGKLTVSIGTSIYPSKAKNAIELFKSADDALYRAKFFDKNRVESYTSIVEELKIDTEGEHIDIITSIKTLISVINAKDKYTYGHVERVVIYSRLLADKLKVSEKNKKELIYGAYMHDIGKINIPKEILNKNMPLTPDEWEIMKQHSVNGVEIIKSVESLKEIAPLILYHHERYDGNGYPDNLKGKEIPYLVRMLTVVDCFDAMTSSRPYNIRKTYKEAIEELKRCSGKQFDKEIVDSFIEVIRENENRIGNVDD
ncbi:bifunctional diguanylate cyclase/phosphohydrolase [Clostridium estertheticum]|uniref:Diguanylate cyclase n=1 Tax=Clostridium estertheticum subsp. estertheticum TaxID=1552 RepID=A0A1J0GDE6_9CLOT|nr:diguanylate cyclase [Clostridium estertheticum]APC39357.1 diguanylate cyclase [Clostridium estertheticum subsp. estertheticum]MBZ9614627.1 diguanylate cyclase [Clostridium estertheticum subsp. laramiense]WAG74552.1 diguanylate cyclase [Clostridium estertheticum]